eukprot:g1594.t1
MARLHTPPLASLMVLALLLPPEAAAFVPGPAGLVAPPTPKLRGQGAPPAASSSRSRRLGPQPLLASSKPDLKDTGSVIAEMEGWEKVITFGTHVARNTKYIVSEGTSLPEVLFDFWKAISDVIDEHRATKEDRGLRKMLMFVAPFCEALREYETMEHMHQLLEQSARDGGCEDFGKDITHLHYHPNYRYRAKPKKPRMGSRHSPHPAFSVDVVYRKGGLKSLASVRAAAEAANGAPSRAKKSPPSPPRLRANATPEEKKLEIQRKKKEEWAASTRSSLEHAYGMAASYGREEADSPLRAHQHQHALAGRGVPESSQEIMHDTQEWLKGVLKDAAESDAAAAAAAAAAEAAAAAATAEASKASPPSPTAAPGTAPGSLPSSPAAALSAKTGGALFSHVGAARHLDTERSTAFNPPTAAEAMAAAAAAARDEEAAAAAAAAAANGAGSARMSRAMSSVTAGQAHRDSSTGGGGSSSGSSSSSEHDSSPHHAGQSTQPRHHTPSVRFRNAAGGLKQAFAHAAERVTVQRGGGEGDSRAAAASAANDVSSSSSSSSSSSTGSGSSSSSGGGSTPVDKQHGAKSKDQGETERGGGPRVAIAQQEETSAARATAAVEGGPAAAATPALEAKGPAGGEAAVERTVEGAVVLPGKELVKRMKDISQYIVTRSKTAEEAYSDVWEVVMEMADRAALRGCSVPTEDYSSSAVPCYGALVVTPDLATYSSDTFFRFQETLNRGLKHLPMEHDISVEAFHPEAVSEATPLDHRFTRSPFPTLHVCYHGLRGDPAKHPLARGKKRVPAGPRRRGDGGGGGGKGEKQEDEGGDGQ